MKLEVSNVWARVIEATEAENEWLLTHLSCEDDRYESPKAKRRRPSFMQDEERVYCMYDRIGSVFPTGLLHNMRGAAKTSGVAVEIDDQREVVCAINLDRSHVAWLRDYQWDAVKRCIIRGRGLIDAPTGSGKCLAPDTLVLRVNGEIAKCRDIAVNDALMGPDGLPRNVLSTTRGTGQMFRIVPTKGDPWECNDVHVLTLVHTETGAFVDVPLNEYLDWSQYQKHLYKLTQPEGPLLFPPQPHAPEIDPYFLGLWFADGTKSLKSVAISKPDPEVKQVMQEQADLWGCYLSDYTYGDRCPTWAIAHSSGAGSNPLLDAMRRTVPANGVVPIAYTHGSVDTRRQFLAGWVDGDGYVDRGTIEISTKEPQYADALLFVARSLGFKAWSKVKIVAGRPYQIVRLIGPAETLPLRIPRKATQRVSNRNRNPLRTGFKVEALGHGPYCGFTLEGDGRFLLGDFTITHNTEIFIALTRLLDCEWLFVVHRTDLVAQAAARYQKRTGERVGTFEGGVWKQGTCNVTVATFQALYRAMTKKLRAGTVIPNGGSVWDLLQMTEGLFVDETHAQPANSYYIVSMACERAYYRFGASATCLDRSHRENMRTMATTGPFAYRISHQFLVEQGVLARSIVRMVECEQWGELDWEWKTVYKQLVTASPERNDLVTGMIEAAAKPCLCFVNHIPHGRELKALLEQSGLTVGFAHGDKDSLSSRRQKIQELERANMEVLLCTVIFQEGIDIPSLRSVVNAAGGDSTVACLQRRGRGSRRTNEAGGDVFELWDVLDLGQRWLERHAETRKAAYESRGDVVHIGWVA